MPTTTSNNNKWLEYEITYVIEYVFNWTTTTRDSLAFGLDEILSMIVEINVSNNNKSVVVVQVAKQVATSCNSFHFFLHSILPPFYN